MREWIKMEVSEMGRRKMNYYAKVYSVNGAYHDFFGYFDIIRFKSKRERDEYVNKRPYDDGHGRMVASGNDYARDCAEHENKMLKYLD